MDTERETVLHSWCRQAEWSAPAIVGGAGARLHTEDGRSILDMSSLAECSNLGHQHPRLIAAIRQQAEQLCFVTSSWGAQPRARLAELLLEKSGFEGGRVFFTLAGADANENAVKFARQASGKPRGKIITRDRSYHGASYATMALSGDGRTQHQLDAAAFGVVHASPPYAYRCPFGSASAEECGERSAQQVAGLIDTHGAQNVAAVMMEPNAGTTMFDPPPEMHARFDAALRDVRSNLGQRHALYIDGQEVHTRSAREKRSPINRDWLLGSFAQATIADVDRAMQAAKNASAGWRAMPPAQRINLLRKVAQLIEERVYHIAAALTLEVGKNRMEALGETQETADFFSVYCDSFEQQQGFDHALPNDPLPNAVSRNRSVMKPYGVWVVITPFNFPLALAGGPVAAALVTGNTVVLKGASETPWAGRLLADCVRDAGLPPGVFNYLSGSSAAIGDALIQHQHTAGVTFTGSHEIGMRIMRTLAGGSYPRPCIAEMGGKNACIVTANADLERAAAGIVRSAFGMGGQKCSALSRLYVEDAVADDLIQKLRSRVAALGIGDPTLAKNWLGPVVSEAAQRKYAAYVQQLQNASILVGGSTLTQDDCANGYYVAPTIAEAPPDHPLWREEMFVPILMLQRVRDLDTAIRYANDSDLGLTAGVYGSDDEVQHFFEHIEAGVTYANRAQGATTGAWPGYQPFGGWKGSGNTGKAIASFYYLAQYLREQSQTVVE